MFKLEIALDVLFYNNVKFTLISILNNHFRLISKSIRLFSVI